MIRLIVRNDKVAISEAEKIEASKHVYKVTGIVRRASTFVDSMNTTMNFAFTFEKEYSKKFFATCVVDIVKERISFAFLTGMCAQSYHPYTRGSEMMMRHGSVFPPVRGLKANDAWSKILRFSLLEDIEHYKATMK